MLNGGVKGRWIGIFTDDVVQVVESGWGVQL